MRVGASRGAVFQHVIDLFPGVQAVRVLEVLPNGFAHVGVAPPLRHQQLDLAHLPFVDLFVVGLHEPDQHAQVALHGLIRESFDDDLFRRRLRPGLVLARNPADDAGDFPGDSGDGVHPGLNRPNPTFPDLCR